ncbi:uncharacterized protein LOC127096238 [Lathyrus oleraceus]|uniref:uncharacterized protein LOC127096238 n=1 Tax=Pisum sativum TaxID=3888 RepID=UPI0021CF2BEF|nr:uncharacterized protein LOC127096238 [Pisum sativum]
MIINYASDELGSNDPDASDGEKEPKYPRFKMQDLDKNYKFKVGLEFVSLENLKRMKKWVGTHKCGRVLNNSFATSKWVAKTVAARMASSDGVKIYGLKKGFTTSYRSFIGVDGCHLKTKYGGTLLIAIGKDPNDQYYPITFGVCETKTKESWRWLLTLLLEDIGQEKIWVFISDQQKGLIPVFEELFERVEHRLCLRNLYANFKNKFGGGTQIRDLMMDATKATYIQACDAKMKELKELNMKAWEWLSGIPTKAWCKHAFSFYPRCDILMNNVSDTFNSTILVERYKSILSMCEWIRNYLMNKNANLREMDDGWNHRIIPRPRLRFDKELEHVGNWIPNWSGDTL